MAVELEFGDASAREALRGRRLRRAVIGTILAILVVGMVVALVLYRQAEAQKVRAVSNEQRANGLVTSGYVTQGQSASVGGDTSRALVYLTAARQGGAAGATVDIPIAEARKGMAAEQAVYRGHRGKVFVLVAFAGGTMFATAGADNIVNLWSVNATTPRFRLTDARATILTLAASHDGKWLAVPASDGRVLLYEVGTGRLVHTWALGEGNIFTAAFSPDDRTVIAYTENQAVGIWDVATGAVIRQWTGTGETAGFGDLSPDGKYLAITSYDRQVRVWDVASGQLARTLGSHADTVWDAAFSPDGTILATASWDKTARLWDLRTGVLIAALVGHSAAVDIVEWSADGAHVASGARDGTVRLWNRKGELESTLQCGGNVHDVQWAPDGRRVLVACGDSTVIFDVSVGLPVFRRQAGGEVAYRVRLLPDGEVLSGEADGSARRWKPASNIDFVAGGHAGPITRLDRCAGDLLLTVSEDHSAKLWSTHGEMVWQSTGLEIEDATCSQTSGLVVAATADGKLWRFEQPATNKTARPTELPLAQRLPPKPIIGLSPDATRLAVVDEDHHALLVATATGLITPGGSATFKRTWEPKLYWASDGSVFALMSDAGAVVWDGATAARRFEVPPPGGIVRRILIDTASGSLFVSAMAPDVHRFSLRDGHEMGRYANAGFAWGMVVIDSSLYVGFDNQAVVEYDVASGRLLRTVGTFGADVYSVADAGHGLLWVGSGNLTLSLVDLATHAVLFRVAIPTEPVFLSARGLDAAIAGLSGMLAFARVDAAPVKLERLELEVRCRATQGLRNGTLESRDPDLAACDQLGRL